jgi:hypothetical protein
MLSTHLGLAPSTAAVAWGTPGPPGAACASRWVAARLPLLARRVWGAQRVRAGAGMHRCSAPWPCAFAHGRCECAPRGATTPPTVLPHRRCRARCRAPGSVCCTTDEACEPGSASTSPLPPPGSSIAGIRAGPIRRGPVERAPMASRPAARLQASLKAQHREDITGVDSAGMAAVEANYYAARSRCADALWCTSCTARPPSHA